MTPMKRCNTIVTEIQRRGYRIMHFEDLSPPDKRYSRNSPSSVFRTPILGPQTLLFGFAGHSTWGWTTSPLEYAQKWSLRCFGESTWLSVSLRPDFSVFRVCTDPVPIKTAGVRVSLPNSRVGSTIPLRELVPNPSPAGRVAITWHSYSEMNASQAHWQPVSDW